MASPSCFTVVCRALRDRTRPPKKIKIRSLRSSNSSRSEEVKTMAVPERVQSRSSPQIDSVDSMSRPRVGCSIDEEPGMRRKQRKKRPLLIASREFFDEGSRLCFDVEFLDPPRRPLCSQGPVNPERRVPFDQSHVLCPRHSRDEPFLQPAGGHKNNTPFEELMIGAPGHIPVGNAHTATCRLQESRHSPSPPDVDRSPPGPPGRQPPLRRPPAKNPSPPVASR